MHVFVKTSKYKFPVSPPPPSPHTHTHNKYSCACVQPHAAQQYAIPLTFTSSKLLDVSCIDHPPNPQIDETPLIVAALFGHLAVAKLLIETYRCDVNEEDSEVSARKKWE